MSQHQMKQGYVPSLHSMFQVPPQDNGPISSSSLLFHDGPGSAGGLGLGGAGGLYSNNLLPQPISAYEQQIQRRPSPIPPAPAPAPTTSAVDQTRITPAASGDVVPRDLKTVYLPRESLPRFLNVAAVNTARNRETCGLLLGKDKKSKFVVTTLLIPKQHSTSDTCTMDEEELVMSFTEERSLITLGWVSVLALLLNLPMRFIPFISDPYPSDPVVFHVLCRPPHPLWFPENVTGIVCRCLRTDINAEVSGPNNALLWFSESLRPSTQLRYLQVDRSTGFTVDLGMHPEGGVPSSSSCSHLYCRSLIRSIDYVGIKTTSFIGCG